MHYATQKALEDSDLANERLRKECGMLRMEADEVKRAAEEREESLRRAMDEKDAAMRRERAQVGLPVFFCICVAFADV